MFGSGLAEVLSKNGMSCEFVQTSSECRKRLKEKHYDVFLCDLNIDKVNGFDLMDELRKEVQETRVYLLTGYHEDFLVQKAKNLGFSGYITKDVTPETLIEIVSSESFEFHSCFAKNIDSDLIAGICSFQPKSVTLSKQEKKIISLLVNGLSSKEIGERLFISKNTVDTHRRNILRKLEIPSTSVLIKFAYENGIVE